MVVLVLRLEAAAGLLFWDRLAVRLVLVLSEAPLQVRTPSATPPAERDIAHEASRHSVELVRLLASKYGAVLDHL